MPKQATDEQRAKLYPHKKRLSADCHELRTLPNGWIWTVDNSWRISFENTAKSETTYTHPSLGQLPAPWILQIRWFDKGRPEAVYFDRKSTYKTTSPRHSDEANRKDLLSLKKSAPTMVKASNMVRNTGQDIQNWVREAVTDDIKRRDQFDVVHIIDPGAGEKGAIGAMNGGVFVVKIKGVNGRLFVEKRFKTKFQVSLAKFEIELARRCRHDALTCFTAAFVDKAGENASLWVEFADRGSLQDLIEKLANPPNNRTRVNVPESFVWNTLIGLCDALMYFKCGRSYFWKGAPNNNWVPLIHRDIKPDNVLLKSRSTLGTKRHFYAILSDFGLACEDWPSGHANEERSQKSRGVCGTMAYLAPELLYPRYPQTQYELDFFPPGRRHTRFSDLWSVVASMYNVCCAAPKKNTMAHKDHTRLSRDGVSYDAFIMSTAGRVPLVLPQGFSPQLQQAIDMIDRTAKRPDAEQYMPELTRLCKQSGFEGEKKFVPLPDWATRVHEYHSYERKDLDVLLKERREKDAQKKKG